MLLDYVSDQIVIIEEDGESFIEIQDRCPFVLCVRLRDGKYQVPYVSLPILRKTIKEVGYKLNFTEKLRTYHKKMIDKRRLLESIKEGVYGSENENVKDVLDYIKETETKIKKHCKTFKGFYGNQIDSIIFTIIGERIVIGNEIGTGKTLTAIVASKYLMERKGFKKTLIMLPASLATNFYEDYNRFFPDNAMIKVGRETKKKRKVMYQDFKMTPRIQFLITNYEKCNFDYDLLKELKFDIIVVDEFHKMKNFKEATMSSNFFKMVEKNWKPRFRIPMSGTPIENKLFDIYPVFKLLDGGMILGGENFFESNFVEYEERTFRVYFSKNNYRLITNIVAVGFKHHTFVKKLISPYVIKKKLDLPAGLYSKDVLIEPSAKFMKKYKEVKLSKVNASARYNALRQFLCDSESYGFKDNPKFDELENILSQTQSKVVIFSFYKCSIRALSKWLNDNGYGCITCQGGDGTDALSVVNRFKKDDSLRCLVTTDKINYGHNIQEAKVVIEWEKPLKPTTSRQRFGRCYRSGQDSDVHTYSFVVKNTIEELILEQLELKKLVIEKVMDSLGTESSDTNLDDVINSMEASIIKKLI